MSNQQSKFKKGETGNPKGRPKGTLNKSTKDWLKMRKLASNDYNEAYDELRTYMKAGEGWAHQLFFKQLVPKKVYNETIQVESEGVNTEDRIKAILGRLKDFKELTYEEAVSELNVLGKLKELNANADNNM